MYLISQLISSHLHSCNLWPHTVFISHGEDKVKSWKDTVCKYLLLLDYGKIMAVNIAIISGILLYGEEFKLLQFLNCVFSSMLFLLFSKFVTQVLQLVYNLQSLQ